MNRPELTEWLQPSVAELDREIEAGLLGHAPLLSGPGGSGKRALAEWLAARLLCLEVDAGNPCGKCRSCQLLASATHPDFFRLTLLEDKREILVDQVRQFIDSLGLTPSLGRRRVGLIEPADALNRNAANALLKTLEEPADEVWLILVADREDRLPATIRSRCQRHRIALPDAEVALEWLNARHPDAGAERCGLALRLADGAPGLADAWLSDGGLDRGLEIGRSLASILDGAEIDTDQIAQWLEDPADAWRWLARYCRFWFSDLLGQRPAFLDGDFHPAGPGAAHVLEHCWESALQGYRLSASPVRHDWLFRSWLLEWRNLARHG